MPSNAKYYSGYKDKWKEVKEAKLVTLDVVIREDRFHIWLRLKGWKVLEARRETLRRREIEAK